MRAQNQRNARQPAGEHRRVLAPVVWLSVVFRFVFHSIIQFKKSKLMIQVKELVITDLSRKGSGKNVFSPVRAVIEVYSKSGDLLAFHDSHGNFSVEDLLEFGQFCLSNKELSVEEIFNKWGKSPFPKYSKAELGIVSDSISPSQLVNR